MVSLHANKNETSNVACSLCINTSAGLRVSGPLTEHVLQAPTANKLIVKYAVELLPVSYTHLHAFSVRSDFSENNKNM